MPFGDRKHRLFAPFEPAGLRIEGEPDDIGAVGHEVDASLVVLHLG